MEPPIPKISVEFARNANIAKGLESDAEPLIAFRDPEQLRLLVRATAFVFADPRSKQLHDLISRIAPSDATVLITGETGTGKELVARHVHALSNRHESSFVAINCGAFSETLIESELFGYERGAFTGAQHGKAGWFETADGGTLFLDEIGDLPMPMQVKLLRVLQEREVVRMGSRQPIPIDVRLIAATNVDLAEAVRAGRFREDLFYRLQVIALPLHSLRERPGDILPLTRHFLQTYANRLHLADVRISAEGEQALLAYPWPGNIRELENVIQRALLVCRDGMVSVEDLRLPGWNFGKPFGAARHLPFTGRALAMAEGSLVDAGNYPYSGNSLAPDTKMSRLRAAWHALLAAGEDIQFEALQNELVRTAWEKNQRNQVRAAKQLNISRNILRTYLKKTGVI